MKLNFVSPGTLFYRSNCEIPGLQILKFICALFVIQIHTESLIKPYVLPLCRIAVPIFFIISGYFLLNKDGKLNEIKILHVLWKIIKITLIANAVYIVFLLLTCVLHPERFEEQFLSVTLKGWIGAIAIGDKFSGPLWYLTAYIEALIILYVVVKLRWTNLLPIILVGGLALNLIIGKYSFIYRDTGFPLFLSRNVIGIGLPCLIIGMAIRRLEHLLPSIKIIVISIIIIGILLMCENYILSGKVMGIKNSGDITLFTVPLAIPIFVIFLKMSHYPRLEPLANLGRVHSLNMYLYHILVAAIIAKIFSDTIQPIQTFMVAVGVIMLSFIIEKGKSVGCFFFNRKVV